MSLDGNGNKLRELNIQLQGENKRIEDVVSEDDVKISGPSEKINYRHEGALPAPPAALRISQQQQSQGSIVCWERFLHLRSLNVLLVEDDNSTRHVVTALLRNCSYEVIEVENGLHAWKMLEDLTVQIDLVLTEVAMPGLSGIGLLHKIMSHKTRNNVPVIMMSSHDSMGLVFKCLSKGAVDFLVKPIRKNELKNLWQHVWRRCHSSSGSGSESGTHTQKSVKSKGMEKSENNSGSIDENGSMGLNVGDGSDNGSGTRSSWKRQAVEVDSSRSASPEDQVAECPDSTCAQVIHSNAEVSGNKQASVIKVKECEVCLEKIVDESYKDKDKIVARNVDLQFIHRVENPTKFVATKHKLLLENASGQKEQIDNGHLDLNIETPSSTLNNPANLTSSNANNSGPLMKSQSFEASIRQSKISDSKSKALNDAKETQSFEHGLKRFREEKDVEIAVQEERNVLRRSDSSAFSRYHASTNVNKGPGVNIKSGRPLDSNLDKTRKGSVCDLQSHSNGDHPNQCSNVGSDNIDMGSTTDHNVPGSVVLKNNSTVLPIKGDLLCAPQQIVSKKAVDIANRKMLAQSRDVFQDRLCQCLAHNCDHHNIQQQKQCCQQPELPPDHRDASLNKIYCGLSNVLGAPVEDIGGNYYSVNGSASGSNHGSNGQNGSSTVVNAGGVNVESDNGIAGKSGSGDGSGSGSGEGNKVDQNKFSQREAALTKFREKRKERCFRKKVRYQSRKRLAEQRPRVRGQFVRQETNESSSEATES